MVFWTPDDYAFIRNINSIQKHLLKFYKCFGILFYSDKLIKIKGSNLKVNNVFGSPYINLGGTNNNTIDLYNQRGRTGGDATERGLMIGQA